MNSSFLVDKYSFISKNSLLVFLFYSFIGFLVYYPTFNSRVVFDQAEIVLTLEKLGVKGVFNGFEIKAISALFVFHIVGYALFKVFGTFSVYNGLFSILIHTINAVFVCQIFNQVSKSSVGSINFIIGGILGFLFLVCPYASEVVVWGCTHHYLLLEFFLLASIYCLIKAVKTQSKIYKNLVYFFHFLSLFTHEISFVFIPVYFLIFSFFNFEKGVKSISIEFGKTYFSILSLSLLLCFLIRFYTQGSFISHYGSEVHLNFNLKEILINCHLYLLKYSILFNNLDFLDGVRSFIHNHIYRYLLIESIIFLSIVYVIKVKKVDKKLVILLLVFILLISPTLNLYFPDYHHIQGDRYGYVASGLFFILIGYIFLIVKKMYQKMMLVYFGILAIGSAYVLVDYNSSWSIASKLMHKIESENYGSGNSYFFLNMPESYKGAYMYKTGNQTSPLMFRFKAQKKPYLNEFYEVCSMNLTDVNNKLIVEKLDSTTFNIHIDKPDGNWFWKGTIGATNYESEYYTIILDQYCGYKLMLKQLPVNSYLLFFSENKIQKIKVN